jgi:3-phenylpropionate/trans-cinnamate dioxygenase ferredoxin reductase subunit
MSDCIVIVGAGQAAVQAVESLRKDGFQGRLVVVGDEPHLPYQRPPLSKKYLAGELLADRLPFRHRPFYDEHRVELHLGVQATALDINRHCVKLSDGRKCEYDQLLLCTGASARRLPIPGAEFAGVHYLRTMTDVGAIRQGIAQGRRVTIIGGGYIGLECAATLGQLGCRVTVLEMTDRVMNRVVAPSVSEFFAREHASHGVKIVCHTRVVRIEGVDRVQRVVCADETTHDSDMVIIGVGSVPNYELAESAGLRCENGILVDEYCRTSDAGVYAAGDCTNHTSLRFDMRVRLESVDSAFEQARTVAANMQGKNLRHDKVPWFWSDQYQHKLMIVGLNQGYDQQIIRGDPQSGSFSVCYLKGGDLIAVESVNNIRDHMAARKLISDRSQPEPAKITDIVTPLKESVL